ncbi:MBL fold metallo-hydrolase [Streptomyces sp. EKR5.2]|uniref:MBL fold metallo-hydrolase n=1 Tax=Streptomyces sp. EKR5.2 TaxID=3461014 RepID=UPI0040427776
MTNHPHEELASNRRAFMKLASVAAAVPTAAALLGGALSGSAVAAEPDGLPDYAPVPSSAFGPALNEDGYFVGQIKDNLYWVTDSYYQAMFLTTRTGVVLVDAPPTIGHNLLRAIDKITKANGMPGKVTHLVYSHFHADHIGASSIFDKNVVRIGHTETCRLLRLAGDPNRPAPSVTFEDTYTLRVGGETLQLAHHGPNHTPDNIFIYAPDQATLMVVDVIFPGWVPFRNLAVSQDIPGWIKAHDIAMKYPWTTLVGGHLGRLGVRTDGRLQKQYVDDLLTSARAATASVELTPFFEKYGPTGNGWAIFKHYYAAVTEATARPVIEKYTGVLAAADVFTYDNAAVMTESLRVDIGDLGPNGIRP